MRKMSLIGNNEITLNNKSDCDRVVEDTIADLKELIAELTEPPEFTSDNSSDYDDDSELYLRSLNYSGMDGPIMPEIWEFGDMSAALTHPLQIWMDFDAGLKRYIYNNHFQHWIDNNLFSAATALQWGNEKKSTKDASGKYVYLTNNTNEFKNSSENFLEGIWNDVVQVGGKVADGAAWVGGKIVDGATWVGDKVVDGAVWVYNHPLEATQGALDIAGLAPGIGEFADGANAVIYAANGDYVNAGLSAGAMIPFVGMGATAGKIGGKVANAAVDAAKIADAAGDAAKIADAAGDAAKIADVAGDAAKIADAAGDAAKIADAAGDAAKIASGISSRSLKDLPSNVQNAYNRYSKNGWKGNISGNTSKTKAAGNYRNDTKILPTTDTKGNNIKYKEFDVNNKQTNGKRDTERFVLGNDGRVYYTNDHYKTFIGIK